MNIVFWEEKTRSDASESEWPAMPRSDALGVARHDAGTAIWLRLPLALDTHLDQDFMSDRFVTQHTT